MIDSSNCTVYIYSRNHKSNTLRYVYIFFSDHLPHQFTTLANSSCKSGADDEHYIKYVFHRGTDTIISYQINLLRWSHSLFMCIVISEARKELIWFCVHNVPICKWLICFIAVAHGDYWELHPACCDLAMLHFADCWLALIQVDLECCPTIENHESDNNNSLK